MRHPTEKQISYIVSLCGGRRADDAYREIAKDMGVSMTAAKRRAAKPDASVTIDRLKTERTDR